jgi:hypothetical protein
METLSNPPLQLRLHPRLPARLSSQLAAHGAPRLQLYPFSSIPKLMTPAWIICGGRTDDDDRPAGDDGTNQKMLKIATRVLLDTWQEGATNPDMKNFLSMIPTEEHTAKIVSAVFHEMGLRNNAEISAAGITVANFESDALAQGVANIVDDPDFAMAMLQVTTLPTFKTAIQRVTGVSFSAAAPSAAAAAPPPANPPLRLDPSTVTALTDAGSRAAEGQMRSHRESVLSAPDVVTAVKSGARADPADVEKMCEKCSGLLTMPNTSGMPADKVDQAAGKVCTQILQRDVDANPDEKAAVRSLLRGTIQGYVPAHDKLVSIANALSEGLAVNLSSVLKAQARSPDVDYSAIVRKFRSLSVKLWRRDCKDTEYLHGTVRGTTSVKPWLSPSDIELWIRQLGAVYDAIGFPISDVASEIILEQVHDFVDRHKVSNIYQIVQRYTTHSFTRRSLRERAVDSNISKDFQRVIINH